MLQLTHNAEVKAVDGEAFKLLQRARNAVAALLA